MTKTDRFVLKKLDGVGTREAARQAGFSAGVPGGHALDVYQVAKRIADYCEDIDARMDAVEQKLKASKKRAKQLRRQRHAVELLEHYRRS